jgi:hypothetical protein
LPVLLSFQGAKPIFAMGSFSYLPSAVEKKFAMVRQAKNLPSDKEKQVCDGTLGGKIAIR